jgi:hypothetical protein
MEKNNNMAIFLPFTGIRDRSSSWLLFQTIELNNDSSL